MPTGVSDLCRAHRELAIAGTAAEAGASLVIGEPGADVVSGQRLVDVVSLPVTHSAGDTFAKVVDNDHVRLEAGSQRGPHVRRDEIVAGLGDGRRSFIGRPPEGIP